MTSTLALAMVTKAQIVEDLKKLGIDKGDSLAVVLSLKSVGIIEGGADAFIDALLEAVGSDGTVMLNAYTYNYPASEIRSKYIFDPVSTAPWTGIVPKMLLKRKGAFRSTHPVCSVVAIGKHAKLLTQDHTKTSRPYMPYAKLAEIQGKYLAIGIGNNLVAIRHEAQYQAGIPTLLRYGVQYRDPSGETHVFVWEHPPCEKNLPSLVPKIDELGIIKHGKVGQAEALLMFADDLIASEVAILKSNPALNQCGDILCVQCREIERKTNFWPADSAPYFFQRSRLMRKTLQLRNSLVLLKRHNRVVIQDKNSAVHYFLDFGFQFAARLLTKILRQ
jgi:aminoglycoside 3-N-acetyltransferase